MRSTTIRSGLPAASGRLHPEPEAESSRLTLCRGAAGGTCRFALPLAAGFAKTVEQTIAASGWPVFLHATLKGAPRHHHAWQSALAACANGCSRPHIADLAFVRAERPILDAAACLGCELCVRACPDQALAMQDGLPRLNADQCLSCGVCIRACAQGALSGGATGWRVLLGGRLGRRPRLAIEAPELFDDQEALGILARSLSLYMERYEPGRRFGDLLLARGVEPGLAEVLP